VSLFDDWDFGMDNIYTLLILLFVGSGGGGIDWSPSHFGPLFGSFLCTHTYTLFFSLFLLISYITCDNVIM